MSKELNKKEQVGQVERVRPTRPERPSVHGARDILTIKDKDPNYEYRWVLDVPGRIAKLQERGWEFAPDVAEAGQKTVDSPSKVGSVVTRAAGGGLTLVAMRIPLEWYKEDQKAKQEPVDALEVAMNAEIAKGLIPGGSGQPGYVPQGGGLQIRRNK